MLQSYNIHWNFAAFSAIKLVYNFFRFVGVALEVIYEGF